jgi:hypothetical protein
VSEKKNCEKDDGSHSVEHTTNNGLAHFVGMFVEIHIAAVPGCAVPVTGFVNMRRFESTKEWTEIGVEAAMAITKTPTQLQ